MSNDDRHGRTVRQRRRRWGASAVGIGAAAGAALAAAMIPAAPAAADDTVVGDAAAVADASAVAVTGPVHAPPGGPGPVIPPTVEPVTADTVIANDLTSIDNGLNGFLGNLGVPAADDAGIDNVVNGLLNALPTPVALAFDTQLADLFGTSAADASAVQTLLADDVSSIDSDFNSLLGNLGLPATDVSGFDTVLNDLLNALPTPVALFVDTGLTDIFDIFGGSAADASAALGGSAADALIP